jgi:hypothetical protein
MISGITIDQVNQEIKKKSGRIKQGRAKTITSIDDLLNECI